MLVRMNTTAAGPNAVYEAGQVYNVLPHSLAQSWIDGSYAVKVNGVKAKRTPAQPDPEDTPPVPEDDEDPTEDEDDE